MKTSRGDIFWCDLDKRTDSRVVYGIRPVVVVSNDSANFFSSVISVIPLTKQRKKELPTHVIINGYGLQHSSIALSEQVMSVDVRRLGKKIGSLAGSREMAEINKCLCIQFGGLKVA